MGGCVEGARGGFLPIVAPAVIGLEAESVGTVWNGARESGGVAGRGTRVTAPGPLRLLVWNAGGVGGATALLRPALLAQGQESSKV